MTGAEIEAVKAALLPLVNDEQDTNMLEAWLFDLARTAIAALDRVRGWRSMDSAPRDGARFIAARFTGEGRNHDGLVQVDYWHSREKGHSYDGLGKFNSAYWPATHWLPLPPPPADPFAEWIAPFGGEGGDE